MADDGSHLVVTWTEGPPTLLDGTWLAPVDPSPTPITPWSGDRALPRPATLSVLSTDDQALASWLDGVTGLGFGLIQGVPPTEDGVRVIADRLGYVRRTIFGDVWELAADVTGHADTADFFSRLRS